MDAGYFKGTTTDQDNRFVDKNKKLMKTMKFGEGLDKKVDMSRVDMEIIRPWINKTITDYLGDEDDVLFEFICNQLDEPLPDGRQMQLNVTGFLGVKNAREFVQKLWQLLSSAMDDICGIPEELKEQKKEQIRIKQEEQGRINATLKTHQSMIQEAITRIKVNAAAAAINSRNFSEHVEKPSGRGRLTMGLSRSRSRSPRNAKSSGKGAKDSEAGNTQPKATDRSAETTEVPPGGPTKPKTDDDRRRKQSSYGRNRIRSPSPRRDRRRSREQSPYRKSSPRRCSRSHGSTRRDPSRRRSPSPHRSKVSSPSRHRSRQRRSSTPERHGAQLSRHRTSHDDNQHRALPDVRTDAIPRKRSQGQSEASGSPRLRHERSRSRSSSAENARDGKTEEKPSVFQHRNYRSHGGGGGRRSSPEDAGGASPKLTNSRGNRNGRKMSFSPALARNDFSPQRKRSPRYSSSVAHRHFAPSPQQNHPPEGDGYPKLEPGYPSRRLSPRLSHSRSQRRSLSVSPGRRAKGQPWVDERRRVSPHPSRYDYHEIPPHLGEGPPESLIRRNRNVSPGYHDNWGSASKWEGIESRQRSPRGVLPEYERRARSPPIDRRHVSPFPDRYAGQHEVRWPASPRRDPRGAVGEYPARLGAPRYEQPREDFDRGRAADCGRAADFGRGISHHRQRRGDSPFRRTVPYESDVREPATEYYGDLPPSRGMPPGMGPSSPLIDRHSRVYARTSGPQRRDGYKPRGVPRGDNYPMRNLDPIDDNYNASADKFDPRLERRGDSYDTAGGGYDPRSEDRLDPRGGGGHAGDVLQMRKHSRVKGDYNSRDGYDLPREDRSVAATRSDRVEDPRRYLNRRSRSSHRSRSQKRSKSPSGARSPNNNSPRSPRWTNSNAWKDENVAESERVRRGNVASWTGPSPSKERTEQKSFDYESKHRGAQQRDGSRSAKRGRSTASSSPDGALRSTSNRARNLPSGGVERQEASVERLNDHGKEVEFADKRNERRTNVSLSPSSPARPPTTKRMKVEEGEGANSAEGSEVEISSKKQKKKKKKEKKKRKKHKKHKKHKHNKRSQEDENEDNDDDSNTDHETQDDELASRTPQSRSNVLDEEQEHELREKAILSLKMSSK